MKEFDQFCSPHTHTASLDSGSTPEAFVKRTLELGGKGIASTEHGSLSVSRKIYDLSRKAGIIPVIGLEGYFRPTDCDILKEAGIEKTVNDKFKHLGPTYLDYAKYCHLTLHFQDSDAFEAGSRILSSVESKAEYHGSEKKPIFDWHHLEELGSYNVTFFSSCLIGIVGRHLMEGRPDIATKYYEKIRSLVKPGNFRVEVFPYDCSTVWSESVGLSFDDGAHIEFHPNKKLKVQDNKGKILEINGHDLAKKFKDGQLDYKLLGHFRNRVLTEVEPTRFNKVKIVEDFIKNECTSYAPDGALQLAMNRFVLDLAKKHKDPVMISGDEHLAYKDDKIAQDVKLLQSGNWRFADSYEMKSSQEVWDFFHNRMGIKEDEFRSWVQNSHDWLLTFKDFKFKERTSLPTKFYPQDTVKHVFELIKSHGRMRWDKPEYVSRLKKEIELLNKNGKMDLLPYFFVQEEVLRQYEKNKQIAGCARGSSAGTLICYLLGITHIDPIKWELSLDRFITKDRIQSGKLPDIDTDLANREILSGKDGTYGFLHERFGKDHVAQISTVGTLRLKSSIKDVHRALHGEVSKEIHMLTKRMSDAPQGISDNHFVFGYDANGEWVKGAVEVDPALKEYISIYPEEWKAVQKCLSLSKSVGIHAAGVVIGNEPISNFIPTQIQDGITITQWPKDDVEAAGGVKIDYLVINVLNDIDKCIKLIQNGDPIFQSDFTMNGIKVPGFRVIPIGDGKYADIWDLPERKEVFKDIYDGKLETIFQLDTEGVRKWIKEFHFIKPNGDYGLNSIYDLATLTALDRPGTLDAYVEEGGIRRNMLQEFAARAKGENPIGEIPEVTALSPKTYGVLCFQESCSKVFQEIGQTTGIEAETFRSHTSKKLTEKVLKDKSIFMKGAVKTVGLEKAEAIWSQLVTAANYNFCLAHSAAYSITGYVTAYLKHFFPLQWWCAVLSNSNRNEIQEKFWKYCSEFVLLPDIKYSKADFTIEGDKLRAPLWLLEGIGEKAHQELIETGPYEDIRDFVGKIEERRIRLGTIVEKEIKPKKNKSAQLALFGASPETPKTEETIKKANSAINRTVVYNLIISGAADALFQPDTDVLTKLQLYETAKAEICKQKITPIDKKFLSFNALDRYMYRKQLMPYFTGSVLPILIELKYPYITKNEAKGMYIYKNTYPFVTPQYLKALDKLPILPSKSTVALAAIVTETRIFTYQSNKEACEFHLDVGGSQLKVVKWPDFKTGKLEKSFKQTLTNALIVAIVSKFKINKEPVLESFAILKTPTPKEEQNG